MSAKPAPSAKPDSRTPLPVLPGKEVRRIELITGVSENDRKTTAIVVRQLAPDIQRVYRLVGIDGHYDIALTQGGMVRAAAAEKIACETRDDLLRRGYRLLADSVPRAARFIREAPPTGREVRIAASELAPEVTQQINRFPLF